MFKFSHVVMKRNGCKPIDYGYVLTLDTAIDLFNYTLKNTRISEIERAIISSFRDSSERSIDRLVSDIANKNGSSWVNALAELMNHKIAKFSELIKDGCSVYIQVNESWFCSCESLEILDTPLRESYIFTA